MLVKVWNDNVHPYTEKFMGKQVSIGAQSFVEMDHNEAEMFLSTFPSRTELDKDGNLKPECYKKLRIQKAGEATPITEPFKCMRDGKVFHSQAELDAHITENYMDEIADEDSRKEFVEKRKPGRPAKGAVTNDSSTNRDSR